LALKNRKAHGINSSTIVEFITEVLYSSCPSSDQEWLDQIRQQLLKLDMVLQVENAGATSKRFKSSSRKLSNMVKLSSVRAKYGELLYRLVQFYQPQTVIELGTSIGLSALYMAKASPESQIVSIEYSASLCRFAQNLARNKHLSNVRVLQGKFDDILPSLAQNFPPPGLVFIDGNHNEKATLRYFEFFTYYMDKGMLVFDDIYWSKGMYRAWKKIQTDARAVAIIDLFQFGIVFLDKTITPGKYRMRY
jgi:predicted O-methyltransferase YrrM